MRHANHGRFQAVVVWKLDRFVRSLRNLVNSIAMLNEYQVLFVSYKDSLDLSTPTGRLMFHVIGAMAEFERELIRERVKAGLTHPEKPGHSAKGKRLGRPVGPHGPHRMTLWRRKQKAIDR